MIINDKELGEIRLVKNGRARKIIVRKKDGYLQLTHPPSVTISYIEKTIEEMRPRLISLIEKNSDRLKFSPQTEFRTYSFSLRIAESNSTSNFYISLKDAILSISCPTGTDFEKTSIQNLILKQIEKALRYEANRLLPAKVKLFAQKCGFTVSDIKINKSRTRWGSCSSKKSINLSYYCMLLPEHLIDHVILHELCHTVEMNHGDRFWQLLDKVTDGKSKKQTKELKAFKTPI
ncbi:M48 family metallopeptidase [Dysgonomonas reticulitermitis]